MPISRPLLIALIAAVVALVGFYATQGMRDADGSSGDTGAAAVPAEPATGSAPAAEGPDTAANGPDTAKRPETAAKASDAARRRELERKAGVPLPVKRALERRKTVVLFFDGGSSADDRATARAVGSLRGRRGIAVFSDRIGRLGRYRAIVGELGISQAPAVVIVDRKRSARVVEGYVDPATLAQDVADSR